MYDRVHTNFDEIHHDFCHIILTFIGGRHHTPTAHTHLNIRIYFNVGTLNFITTLI